MTPESVSPRLSFVVRSGKFKGQRYPLFTGMVIGRGEQAHLYLPDFKASRKHCRVSVTNEGFSVEDLGSHNGTFLNGERIGRSGIGDGDLIHIGSTRLEVVADAPPEQAILDAHVAGGLVPTIVRRVDMLTPPTLDELPREEYFTPLGIPSPGDVREAGPDLLRRILTKTRNFAIVNEIAKALGAAVHLDTLLEKAMDFILKVVDAERGYLILLDPETGQLVPGVARGEGTEDGSLEISSTIVDWVLRERSAVVSSDASTDQRFAEKQSIVLYNIRSVLCSPMMHGDRVVGLIHLDSLGSGAGFSEEDLELISVIAPVLAVAVENTRLIEAQEATIAELRKAHTALVAAQEQLVAKEKMAIVGRLTTGLAHEIRNLMGPFMLADLLAVEYPDDERIQDYAELMLEAYGRIGSLVEEMRLMSRGEQLSLDPQPHDVAQVIASVIRFVSCDQEVRRHKIVLKDGGLPPFDFDAQRVKQVLINLIRNGVQSMEQPGEILIRTFAEPARPHIACIEVVDRGAGISEEHLERIWEPFFSTKVASGTGLGLDVCRQIVDRHGGRIDCRSVVGSGTTMTVYLPMEIAGGPPLHADTDPTNTAP